jgi:hypothetical protein
MTELCHLQQEQLTGMNREKARTGNSVLPQLAVTFKTEAECSYQTFVQVDSEVLRNRQLRQHANRYVLFYDTPNKQLTNKQKYKWQI